MPAMPMHLPVIVATRSWRDWFEKRYWVRCWDCEERSGPWHTHAMASYTFKSFSLLRCHQDSRA